MRAGLEAFFSFLSPKHWIGGRKGGGLELLSPVLRRKKRDKTIKRRKTSKLKEFLFLVSNFKRHAILSMDAWIECQI